MIVRFTGFGGQGILMLAQIYGAAAALEGKRALQTQSYGSAARGGASKSDVTVQDGPIHELEAETADVLVCLSQPAFEKYGSSVVEGGTLIYESDLVKPGETPATHILPVTATIAAKEKFGSGLFANMLVLGFVTQIINIVEPASVEKVLLERIPRKKEENRKAFNLGRELATKATQGSDK